ncbi:nucleoid-associated protein [Clostridium formicaceticum]|uniref:Nucleoid-associated bacterial protein n=1 Tax=Clostridium formicaceticum TaxID=1497 RepID=A0AAC9RKZ9_9CLOT|nr:nucleoid-associated protein [Clostridium formicaceticum]AOY76535.1 nucleoid-associated bacterial protein [Clostridium formicaceticum]ARE86948.1 37-kD nucleoid-associated bacterial protein [Clostridium formicaceticum]
MEQENSLRIIKAILHILDNNVQIPIISSKEIEITEEIFDFLGKHILKVIHSDKIKNGVFNDEYNTVYNLCKKITSNIEEFVTISTELANDLFDIMKKNPNIPPGDMVFCIFEMNHHSYLAIMKFNYISTYIHYVTSTEEGNVNNLIRQTTTLPNTSQKLEECIIINLVDYEIKLLEKEYEMNGSKDFYLSKLFLRCSFDLSDSDKFKILNKVTKKLNKKFFDDDFTKTAKLQTVLAESLEETDEIKVDRIADEVFEGNHEIKEEYMEEIKKEGLSENAVKIEQSNTITKKLRTHKLKTDSGIEINLPLNYYNNKDIIEFINNPDGTISILLKNITKILNK